jgi:hypothetical protein
MTNSEKKLLLFSLDFHNGNVYPAITPFEKVSKIEDKTFHDLRMDYIEARHALLKYIGYN